MEPTPPNPRLKQTPAEATRLDPLQRTEQEGGRAFDTPEEVLRYDASQVTPPPALETRLKESVAREAPPKLGWWRRLFGRR